MSITHGTWFVLMELFAGWRCKDMGIWLLFVTPPSHCGNFGNHSALWVTVWYSYNLLWKEWFPTALWLESLLSWRRYERGRPSGKLQRTKYYQPLNFDAGVSLGTVACAISIHAICVYGLRVLAALEMALNSEPYRRVSFWGFNSQHRTMGYVIKFEFLIDVGKVIYKK